MIAIKVGSKEYKFDQEIRLNELPEANNKEFYVGRVNNRMRELSYKFYYDAEVEFLSMDNPETVHIYEQSLRYLIAMAFKNIYPEYKIKCVSRIKMTNTSCVKSSLSFLPVSSLSIKSRSGNTGLG